MAVTVKGMAIVIAFVFITQICLPNIERTANITKAADAIVSLNHGKQGVRFFYPWPYIETGLTLGRWTRTDVQYLKDGRLSDMMLGPDENYLITDIQSGTVTLDGAVVAEPVYANSTWQINSLQASLSHEGQYVTEFPLNTVQKLKNYLKNI